MKTSPSTINYKMLATVILSTALAGMGTTITNLIAPQLAREFQASSLQINWLVNGFMTVLAASVLLTGSITTKYSRKKALLWGNIIGAVFLLISCLPNISLIIIGRLGCGLAAAFVLPVSLAIVSTLTPANGRTKAIALWSALGLSSAPVANVLGSALVTWTGWWGWAYLWILPLFILAIWLVNKNLPDDIGEKKSNQVDWLGGLLSFTLVGTLIYFLSDLAGGFSINSLWLLIFMIVISILFFFQEKKHPQPLISFNVFKAKPLALAASSALVVYGSLYGALYIAVQYMTNVLNYSPLMASIGSLPISVMSLLLGAFSAKLVQKRGSRYTILLGMVMIALGFACMLLWRINSPYWILGITFLIFGFGTGLCSPPIAAAYMTSVGNKHAGMAGGLQDLAKDLGGALGIAIFGVIFAGQYTGYFANSNIPSQQVAEITHSISSSFSGAQLASAQLPQYSTLILENAKLAFIDGKESAVRMGLILVVLAFSLVWFIYPKKEAEEEFINGVEKQNN